VWTAVLLPRQLSNYRPRRIQEIEASMDTDIFMDIHIKPVDMDMDMDAKFHILAEPGCRSWHIVDCWKSIIG